MNEIRTFHELLEGIFSTYSAEAALNYRKAGVWNSYSAQSIYLLTKHLALGLDKFGIRRGVAIGIMGHPSPNWIITDLAIMSIGGISVPIFPDEPTETRAHKINDASLDYMFLLDENAHAEIKPHIDKFKAVISITEEEDSNFTSFAKLMELGRKIDSNAPARFEEIGSSVQPSDLSTIYYTSGSTGHPKGVELTHANMMSQIKAASLRIPLLKSDRALSCLPLAHSFERFMVYYYIASGVPVYFNSDIHKLAEDLRKIKPSVVGLVPRILEKFYEMFHEKIEHQSTVKRTIGRMAEKWAFGEKSDTRFNKWKSTVANALVFRKLHHALGGGLRVVITGGAAMPVELYRFFINAGVPVLQGYGMTEASPVLAVNAPCAQKIGTVGLPFPGVDIKISDEGEIMARGPNIMRSYHNLPAETAEVLDGDGWLHTGDLGTIDKEGYLTVTGRKKELMKTSSGEYVAPIPIEHALCRSPLVDMVMLIAEGKPYVTCLIHPARIMNIVKLQEVKEWIRAVNEGLEHWEQIREYRVIHDDFSVESGILTPTMKIRRHVVLTKYKDQIEEMYEGKQANRPDLTGRVS